MATHGAIVKSKASVSGPPPGARPIPLSSIHALDCSRVWWRGDVARPARGRRPLQAFAASRLKTSRCERSTTCAGRETFPLCSALMLHLCGRGGGGHSPRPRGSFVFSRSLRVRLHRVIGKSDAQQIRPRDRIRTSLWGRAAGSSQASPWCSTAPAPLLKTLRSVEPFAGRLHW